jgi:hypothetical protein
MKVGRNDPCPCGSGKKYKHCCYAKDSVKHDDPVVEAAETESEEPEDTEQEEGHHHPPHRHNSGRARFQGGSTPGSSGFRPNLNRGGQRGQ